MKLVILLLIFISYLSNINSLNCVDITPRSSDDCALSLEDKTKYSYCCYANRTDKRCLAYDDSGYSIVKHMKEYICNDKLHVPPPLPPKKCDEIEPKKPSDCVFYATYTPSKYIKDIPKDELPKNVSTIFISNYKNTGIIPSILIAHFLIQSNYAQSDIFINTNNGFNMKCVLVDNTWKYSSWTDTFKYTKNDIDYRVYDFFEESIADYSAYLLGAKKDNSLIFEGIKNCKDYKKAAKILKDGEFPNDENYEKNLVDIINQYDLTQYDTYEEDTTEESIRHCCYYNWILSECKSFTHYELFDNYEINTKEVSKSLVCKTKPSVNNNCNNIIPSKPSDCTLSEKDKETYKHCCYYNNKNKQFLCMALNSRDYKDAKDTFEDELTDGSFVCDAKSNGNNGGDGDADSSSSSSSETIHKSSSLYLLLIMVFIII